MSRRKHWMDIVADDVRERVRLMLPMLTESVKGDAPFGYEPPNPRDELQEFLGLDQRGRVELYTQLGPEEYERRQGRMMTEATRRFGPLAQHIMPMIAGVPAEAMLANPEMMQEGGLLGIAAARAELEKMLGTDRLEV